MILALPQAYPVVSRRFHKRAPSVRLLRVSECDGDCETLYNSLQLSLQVRCGLAFILQAVGSELSSSHQSEWRISKSMPTEPTTVFYVDDNANSRRLLANILRESGFEVITASDPLEALEVCKQISFDLALLDHRMPKMTGSQLAEEIKFLTPDVPVVLISGRSSLPPAELAFVDAHFGSGTTLDELLDSLRMLVQHKLRFVQMSRSTESWADST